MKWATHRLITRKVCLALKILDTENDKLVDACVLPDLHPEYYAHHTNRGVRNVKIKHHSKMALKVAWIHLRRARRLLLDNKDCSEELGRALHYLQDYALDPRKKVLFLKIRSAHEHNRKETLLANYPIPERAVEEGSKITSPVDFEELLRKVKPSTEVEEIMFRAAFLSTAAVNVVFNPTKKGYRWKTALLVHFGLLSLPFVIVAYNTLLLPAAIAIAIAIHKFDFHFHNAKLEKDWFD